MHGIPVDPGSPRSIPIFQMLGTFSDMAAIDLAPLTQGVVSHSDACDSKATTSPPPEDTAVDISPKPQWLDPEDTPPANDVDNVPIQDPAAPALEKGISHWLYALPSVGSQCYDFEPHYGTQSPSALQGESPAIHESQSFASEYPHGLTASFASEPGTPIKEEDFGSDDPTLGLFHPVPRYGFYTASGNMALFPDKMEHESVPIFNALEVPQEEHLSEQSIVPKTERTSDDLDLGTVPMLDESSSGRPLDTVDASFTTTHQTRSPDSSLSWSPYQVSFDMQHEVIDHNEFLCPSGYDLLNIEGQEHQASEWFDQPAIAANDLHASTLLSNVSHSYVQQPVHLSPCRPDYTSLTTNPDTTPTNRDYDILRVTAETFAYHESLFRFNQLTQARFAIDTSHHTRQYLMGNRTFTCPNDARNAFLIDCKRLGLSYRDIKRLGHFPEAESTLRGRYRTLTKSKDQRVRKPQWHEKDLRLLCEAVTACSETGKKCCHHSHNPNRRPRVITESPRVPWKKVAHYILTHGGSYHFGNATCKKKWCEIHGVRF